MTPLMLFAAGLGLGLFLVIRAIVFVPASLIASMERLDRVGVSVADQQQPAIKRTLSERLANHLDAAQRRDLAVLERSPARFAFEKLASSIGMLAAGLALVIGLTITGVAPPVGLCVVLLIITPTIGFIIPDFTIKSQARARRDNFRHALSSYLDLVNVLLAGGAGTETALEAAAEAGDGWAFAQLRAALLRARTLRQSPWECFRELSDMIGVAELAEIAASVQLAGEQGARVKVSLAARAASLRAHQMARIEAQAQAATERMGLPTVLMFLGFMVLLGYPAMQQIVRGF